ncbi:MAG: hypothetical protein HIU93_14635 [Acidobacteria bacterium]|nr:hypothetical protein [Acidobacteriota bacterium]
MGINGRTAKITTLAVETILSENDEEVPSRIHPAIHIQSIEKTEHANSIQSALTYTFPNTSVTVLEITLKKSL